MSKFGSGAFLLIQPTWVPDVDATACRLCQTPFTQLNRRHHCRNCGDIFCGKCCSKKMQLPQFGYENPERVCDNCAEVAYLVSYTISSVISTQLIGARGLTSLTEKEGGIAMLVNHGGLDALIFICSSPHQELNIVTTSAIEHFSKIPEMQNTLVVKGVFQALFYLISFSSQHLTVLLNISRTLLNLSKNADISEQILIEGGFHPLLNLASRKLPSVVQNGSSVLDDIAMIQALGARCISYLSTNQKNQIRMIEDKKGGLDLLFKLLSSQNELVRKYIAKSLAFLSLRNDRLKIKLLQGNGPEMLLNVIMNPNTKNETVSHACCTIANLATNKESQAILIGQEKLFLAFQTAVERHSDIEIKRHVARGLANFALYETNQERMTSLIPLLVSLGQLDSVDIQRHVVRAVDNLLASDVKDIRPQMKQDGVDQLLRQLISKRRASGDDTSKRAFNALAKFELERDASSEDMRRAISETTDEGGGEAARHDPTTPTARSQYQSREGSVEDLSNSASVPDNRISMFDPEAHFGDFVDRYDE